MINQNRKHAEHEENTHSKRAGVLGIINWLTA